MKYFAIMDEIYHKNFHLIINESEDDVMTWLEKKHGKLPGNLVQAFNSGQAMVIWDYAPFYYVWLKTFDWKINEQACLMHELSHVVDFVLTNAGIKINKSNTEVRAYYLEYLMKQVYKKLSKLHHDKKVKQ